MVPKTPVFLYVIQFTNVFLTHRQTSSSSLVSLTKEVVDADFAVLAAGAC